jgi:branched-chain amino acid transport system permease protein
MLALNTGRVNPTSFTLLVSIYLLVAVVVGGAATVIGPVVGAVVFGVLNDIVGPELPGRFENSLPLILGTLLVLQMLIAPNGIVGQFNDLKAKIMNRHTGVDAEVMMVPTDSNNQEEPEQ